MVRDLSGFDPIWGWEYLTSNFLLNPTHSEMKKSYSTWPVNVWPDSY